MTAFRFSFLSFTVLLAAARLHAITPAMKSLVTIQGVISYTAPQTPKTISAATTLVEYKATQTALRFTTADLIESIINNSNPAEIKKWTLVAVRDISSPGVDLDYSFYLVNANKTIAPRSVSSNILSTAIYGFVETYTERWQGASNSAVPVSGSGTFKFLAGIDLSLEDGGYNLNAMLTGPATGSYKIASNSFGPEKHVVYVPSAIKVATSGVVTLSHGTDTVTCVGEFTLTIAASQPIDLEAFLSPGSSGQPPLPGFDNGDGSGVVVSQMQ